MDISTLELIILMTMSCIYQGQSVPIHPEGVSSSLSNLNNITNPFLRQYVLEHLPTTSHQAQTKFMVIEQSEVNNNHEQEAAEQTLIEKDMEHVNDNQLQRGYDTPLQDEAENNHEQEASKETLTEKEMKNVKDYQPQTPYNKSLKGDYKEKGSGSPTSMTIREESVAHKFKTFTTDSMEFGEREKNMPTEHVDSDQTINHIDKPGSVQDIITSKDIGENAEFQNDNLNTLPLPVVNMTRNSVSHRTGNTKNIDNAPIQETKMKTAAPPESHEEFESVNAVTVTEPSELVSQQDFHVTL